MSGGFIKVQPAALEAAEGDLSAAHARMGERMAQLQATIGQLAQGWSGQAQQTYLGYQRQWDAAWQELTAALADFRRATGAANANYQAGEARNISRFA